MKGKTVLIVEDCYLMAATLEDMLIEADASVCLAASVAAALEAMERHTIDIACLDINLGAETSFPVADALAGRGIPFIFVSAYDASVLPAAHRDRPFVDKIRAHLELLAACRAATPPALLQLPAAGAASAAKIAGGGYA
jgi:CheY-like chemotaxis protein